MVCCIYSATAFVACEVLGAFSRTRLQNDSDETFISSESCKGYKAVTSCKVQLQNFKGLISSGFSDTITDMGLAAGSVT